MAGSLLVLAELNCQWRVETLGKVGILLGMADLNCQWRVETLGKVGILLGMAGASNSDAAAGT